LLKVDEVRKKNPLEKEEGQTGSNSICICIFCSKHCVIPLMNPKTLYQSLKKEAHCHFGRRFRKFWKTFLGKKGRIFHILTIGGYTIWAHLK
jgi:hypothetical protein